MVKRERWINSICISIMMIVLGVGFLGADEKTERIIAELETKASKVSSCSADIAMTMDMMGQKMTTNGKYLFKTPNKIHMETDIDMGAMKMKQIYISDGKTAWAYQPTMNMVTKFDMEKLTDEMKEGGMGQKPGDISKPFQGFDKESVTFDRKDKIEDSEVYVFQGKPQAAGMQNLPFTISKMEIWIGADNGLAQKMILFDDEGKEIMTQSYSNIEVNVDLDDSKFTFTPPEGVQVMDMTEKSMDMMKQMRGAPE